MHCSRASLDQSRKSELTTLDILFRRSFTLSSTHALRGTRHPETCRVDYLSLPCCFRHTAPSHAASTEISASITLGVATRNKRSFIEACRSYLELPLKLRLTCSCTLCLDSERSESRIELPANGESYLCGPNSESDETTSTASCGHATGGDTCGGSRNGEDGEIEKGSPDIGDGAQCRTHDQKETGVLSALRIMFSTPQNASFFVSVTLSGMGKGVIETFLFVW